jgi:hypothetical protein
MPEDHSAFSQLIPIGHAERLSIPVGWPARSWPLALAPRAPTDQDRVGYGFLSDPIRRLCPQIRIRLVSVPENPRISDSTRGLLNINYKASILLPRTRELRESDMRERVFFESEDDLLHTVMSLGWESLACEHICP